MTIPAFYPGAIWVGSPNFWPGDGGHPIRYLVDHVAEGPWRAVDSTFQDQAPINPTTGKPDPNLAVSAHFCVCRDGTVRQYVKLTDRAWANGIVEAGATLPSFATPGLDPNWETISKEHEGDSGEPLTEAQYQASLKLDLWLFATFGLPADLAHKIGHNRISPLSRPDCPGPAHPWARFAADYARANPPQEPTVNDQEWLDLAAQLYARAGQPFNPRAATVAAWLAAAKAGTYLGRPRAGEYDVGRWRLQEYELGHAYAEIANWANRGWRLDQAKAS